MTMMLARDFRVGARVRGGVRGHVGDSGSTGVGWLGTENLLEWRL